MKTWLIIINNFLHDLFTGFWISTVLVIYLLKKEVPAVHGLPAKAFEGVMKVFFGLGIFSLLVIIITGILRSVSYNLIGSDFVRTAKKKALIVKHILLGLVFLGGTFLAYNYAFK